MNNDNIKRSLRLKVLSWADLLSSELREIILQKAFVSGGAIASILLQEKINDYDIYFKDIESAEKLLQYYCLVCDNTASVTKRKFKNTLGEEEERLFTVIQSAGITSGKGVKAITSNAVTLDNKIQLITRFSGTPEQVHKYFDFVHCMCSYDLQTGVLILPPEAVLSMLQKRLVYRGSLYPIATLFRLRKYLKRGWTISAGQLVKIAYQLKNIDWDDKEQLYDQLIGVDQYYMRNFMELLNKVEGPVDTNYLIGLLDTCFGEEEDEQSNG